MRMNLRDLRNDQAYNCFLPIIKYGFITILISLCICVQIVGCADIDNHLRSGKIQDIDKVSHIATNSKAAMHKRFSTAGKPSITVPETNINYKLKIESKYLVANKSIFKITRNDNVIGTAFSYKYKYKGNKYNFIISANHTFVGKSINNVHLVNDYLDKKIKINKVHTLDIGKDLCILFPHNYKELDDISTLESYDVTDLSNYVDIYSFNYSAFEPDVSNALLLSKGYILYKKSIDSLIVFMPLLNKGGSGAPVLIDESRIIGMIVSRILTENYNYTGIADVLSIESINQMLEDYIKHNANINSM